MLKGRLAAVLPLLMGERCERPYGLLMSLKKLKFSRGKLPTMGFLLKLISVIDILLPKLPVRCVVTRVKIVSMLVCNALKLLPCVTL